MKTITTLAAVATLFVVPAALDPLSAEAQPASLEGSWSGGGQVQFPSGDTERARCRATFYRRGGNSFDMSATCATPSIRVQQNAVVERIGPNRFIGDFHNTEYGITGSISITLKGRALTAALHGGGGSAHFNLGR